MELGWGEPLIGDLIMAARRIHALAGATGLRRCAYARQSAAIGVLEACLVEPRLRALTEAVRLRRCPHARLSAAIGVAKARLAIGARRLGAMLALRVRLFERRRAVPAATAPERAWLSEREPDARRRALTLPGARGAAEVAQACAAIAVDQARAAVARARLRGSGAGAGSGTRSRAAIVADQTRCEEAGARRCVRDADVPLAGRVGDAVPSAAADAVDLDRAVRGRLARVRGAVVARAFHVVVAILSVRIRRGSVGEVSAHASVAEDAQRTKGAAQEADDHARTKLCHGSHPSIGIRVGREPIGRDCPFQVRYRSQRHVGTSCTMWIDTCAGD
jgi:hypothetical protein